jgi:hypothetical protein
LSEVVNHPYSQERQPQQEPAPPRVSEEIHDAQRSLFSMMETYKQTAERTAFDYQRQINEMSAQIRNREPGQDRRERSHSPHRYAGENKGHESSYSTRPDYQTSNYNDSRRYTHGRDRSQSRERTHSPAPNRNRERSHSPTPRDNTCYACNEPHWIINCPYSTRIERELELLKVLQRLKDKGTYSKKREEELRAMHNCPEGKRNRYLEHDQGHQPAGNGHYCKWCHTRGHSTWICPKFCAVCEESGHGWESCTKDPSLVAQRKDKYGPLIQRFKVYGITAAQRT